MKNALRPAAAALLLAAGACSHAHVAGPKHSWMPASHAVYDHMTEGELSNDIQAMAVGAVLVVLPLVVDTVCLPFHGLGHIFARGEPVSGVTGPQ